MTAEPAHKKRKWGASCVLCRQRKQRCPGRDDAGRSLCQYCPSLGLECHFTLPGFVTRMDQAAKNAEELEHFVRTLAAVDDEDRARMLSEWSARRNQEPWKPPRKRKKRSPVPEESNSSGATKSEERRKRTLSNPNVLQDFAPAPAAEDVAATAQEDDFRAGVRKWDSWAVYVASEAMLFQPEISQLLDAFFCWQNTRYSFIDNREVFLRAKEDGDESICSQFLLWAIYAYASRVVPELESRCDEFAAVAQAFLAVELTKPSHITTAQGLLILGAHHGVRGRHSQAWQQKGFAKCMINDLEMLAEQRGDRKQLKLVRRLYWSLHCWDTIQSLSMNRPPMVRAEGRDPVKDLADDLKDDGSAIWTPTRTPFDDTTMPSQPQRSFESRIFALSAQLYIIIDNVLERLYSGSRDLESGNTQAFVFKTREQLLEWQGNVGDHLYLNVDRLPMVPPPPHLLQFNLLIRLLWILLYRNYCVGTSSGTVTIEGALAACMASAKEIYALFAAYEHAYPLIQPHRLTYLAHFAAFCSSVVEAQQLKAKSRDTPAILGRLAVLLRVLETGRANVPGLANAIGILHQQIAEAANRSQHSPIALDGPSPPSRPSPTNPPAATPPPVVASLAAKAPLHEMQPYWSDFLLSQTDIAALCPGLSLTGSMQLRPAAAPRTTVNPAWPLAAEPADGSDWFARLAAGTW